MSTNLPLLRRLGPRFGGFIALIFVVGLLPSVADSVASAQSDGDSAVVSDDATSAATPSTASSTPATDPSADTTADTTVADTADPSTNEPTSSTGAEGTSSTTDTTVDTTTDESSGSVEDVDGSTATSSISPDTTGLSPDDSVPGDTTATSSIEQDPTSADDTVPEGDTASDPSEGDLEDVDIAETGDGPDTSDGTTEDDASAETDPADTDPAADGETDTAADDAADEEILDDTGDGNTVITEKLEPLPGFTGGGAVISSNPIRRLGGGWYEQPVMVVGRNATAEIEAAIRDAERQSSADARALIEVQARIAELTATNELDSDEADDTGSDVDNTDAAASSESESESETTTDRPEASDLGSGSSAGAETAALPEEATTGPDESEQAVSPVEIARVAAWQAVRDEGRSRLVNGADDRLAATLELNIKRVAFDAASVKLSQSDAQEAEARETASALAEAERDAQQDASEAELAASRAEAAVVSAGRAVERYDRLLTDARAGAAAATEEYEVRRVDLRAVAVAWYVGSEVLAGEVGDLVEATTADNRVEIGRVEALSLLDDRRELLKVATDRLTAAQALLADRRYAVREAKKAHEQTIDTATSTRAAARTAQRSAIAAERSAATALAEFDEARQAVVVDQRRLAVATRERDAAAARLETVGAELVSAREAFVLASVELGQPVSDDALAFLVTSVDDHDHFAELGEGSEVDHASEHRHDQVDADAEATLGSTVVTTTEAPKGRPTESTATIGRSATSTSSSSTSLSSTSSSSTSSTEPLPSAAELAVQAAADAAARAEEERLVAERAEQAADAAARQERAAAEIASLKAQAKDISDRRGLAPSALRSLLNSSSVTFPIAGEWNFIDSWGFPRSGGRRHKGSDIFAPQGTPLVAIEDGRVKAKTNNLGGNVVYLYGDSGNTYYYAHLSAFHPRARAGGRIKAGEVLGFVGTSGNARGTPPHLHIGLKGPGTSAINPYPLMRALSEAVVAEQRRGARATVSPFVMTNLSADVISQLVAEGVPLLPSVVASLPPNVKADLQRRGLVP